MEELALVATVILLLCLALVTCVKVTQSQGQRDGRCSAAGGVVDDYGHCVKLVPLQGG